MMKVILLKKDVQNPLFPKILPVYLNKICRKDAIKKKSSKIIKGMFTFSLHAVFRYNFYQMHISDIHSM